MSAKTQVKLLLFLMVSAVLFTQSPVLCFQKIETLSFNQTKLGLVLQILSKKTGVKFVTSTELADRPISAYLENISGEEAIDSILQANGLYRQKVEGTDVYVVYGDSSSVIQSECFPLKYARAQDIQKALVSLGFKDTVAVDVRTNYLIVKDTVRNVALIRNIVSRLDVAHNECALKTKIFRLKYAQATELWAILPSILKKGKSEKESDSKATFEIGGQSSTTSTLTGGSGGTTAGTSGTTGSTSGTTASTTGTGSGTSAGTGTSSVSGTSGSFLLGGTRDRTMVGKVRLSTDMGDGFAIVPDERTNSIVCVGTQDFLAEVEELLANLDRPIPQVSIEAVVVELTENAANDIGLRWGDTSQSLGVFTGDITQNVTKTSGSPTVTKVTTNLNFKTLTADLRLLETKGEANILANPRVTTLNNNPATIRITSNIPIAPVVTTTSTGATGTTTTQYEFRDIGIVLVATPHVNDEGLITLDVSPQVIAAKKSDFFTDAVETSERSTLTRVMAKDGEIIVIGGLLNTEQLKSSTRVPVLGHILPFLFSNRVRQTKKTDLVIFLSPKILSIEEAGEVAAKEKARMEKVNVPQ